MSKRKNQKDNKSSTKTYQFSLDKWFVRKDQEGNVVEAMSKVFYLDWRPEEGIIECKWLSNIPETDKITFQSQINWKDLKPDLVELVGFFPNSTNEEVKEKLCYDRPSETFYTNISYLKSHLQKCIRRSQVRKALLTAHHFMNLDLSQFLRRLAIIMVEDCTLNQSFMVLSWLTAAHSKGYELKKDQIYWLYGLVYHLAKSKYWHKPIVNWEKKPNEDNDTTNKDTKKQDNNQNNKKAPLDWKKFVFNKLTPDQKSIIYSLQFRKSFGGLSGDRVLIDNVTYDWYLRFVKQGNNKSQIDNVLIEEFYSPINWLSPPEEKLSLTEWILPAIDFHCEQGMLSILCDKFEQYEYEDLKKSIWIFSSSYNNKTQLTTVWNKTEDLCSLINTDSNGGNNRDPHLLKIWEEIRPQFYSLTQYFLEHNY